MITQYKEGEMNRKRAFFAVLIFVFSLGLLVSASSRVEAKAGEYGVYSEEAFESAKDSKRVLYFFASWCPSCVKGDRALKKFDVPDDVAVFKIDFDTSTVLKRKYGVVRQHTFVYVDSKGEKVNLWSGGPESIIENVE